jgi:predicted amidophosphoribosyltransferase
VRALSLIVPPLCAACRRPAGGGAVLCPPCVRAVEWLPRRAVAQGGLAVWAPVAYEGPARAIVGRLKRHGARALAEHMAAAIAAAPPPGLLEHPLAAVPSPPARRRMRGFCHAELLARALAARTGLPVLRVLERDGPVRQVGRPRAERLRSPPRFRAAAPGARERVILIDDVVTTGATLAACARALAAAGWRCDQAVAYARTPVR